MEPGVSKLDEYQDLSEIRTRMTELAGNRLHNTRIPVGRTFSVDAAPGDAWVHSGAVGRVNTAQLLPDDFTGEIPKGSNGSAAI